MDKEICFYCSKEYNPETSDSDFPVEFCSMDCERKDAAEIFNDDEVVNDIEFDDDPPKD